MEHSSDVGSKSPRNSDHHFFCQKVMPLIVADVCVPRSKTGRKTHVDGAAYQTIPHLRQITI